MAFHRCLICREDGSVVATGVQVTLEVTPDGDVEWYGTITQVDLTTLAAGERYLLELDDGRKGEFLVRRNTSAGERTRAIAIRGAGPLK